MKRIIVITGIFCMILLIQPHNPQGASLETNLTKNETILGIWTVIYYENGGDYFSSIELAWLNGTISNPNPRGYGGPFIWKISKEKIEVGPDNWRFPTGQYTYILNPGGEKGTIDKVNTRGGAINKAIYFLKDDLLVICGAIHNAPRPRIFTTTPVPNHTWMHILRRGKLRPIGNQEGGKVNLEKKP